MFLSVGVCVQEVKAGLEFEAQWMKEDEGGRFGRSKRKRGQKEVGKAAYEISFNF